MVSDPIGNPATISLYDTPEDYIKRLRQTAQETALTARDEGSAIHKAIEAYYKGGGNRRGIPAICYKCRQKP